MGVSKIMGHSWAQISSTGAGNKPECFSEHQKVGFKKKLCGGPPNPVCYDMIG